MNYSELLKRLQFLFSNDLLWVSESEVSFKGSRPGTGDEDQGPWAPCAVPRKPFWADVPHLCKRCLLGKSGGERGGTGDATECPAGEVF